MGQITTYTALGIMTISANAGRGRNRRCNRSLGGLFLIGMLLLVAAALLVLFGVTRLGVICEPGWLTALSPERIPGFKRALQGATEHPGTAVFYLLGIMLGFLPCGLSYAAFAQALGTGNAAQCTCWCWRLRWARAGLSCSAPAPPPSSAATAGSPTSSPAR
jgi:sulfite exporter TauE/SafE